MDRVLFPVQHILTFGDLEIQPTLIGIGILLCAIEICMLSGTVAPDLTYSMIAVYLESGDVNFLISSRLMELSQDESNVIDVMIVKSIFIILCECDMVLVLRFSGRAWQKYKLHRLCGVVNRADSLCRSTFYSKAY